MLDAQEIADQVDIHHKPPRFGVKLFNRAGAQNAGIADQYVQPPELVHGALYHSLNLRLVGHVDRDGQRATIRALADRRGRLVRRLAVNVGDDHVRPFLRQAETEGLAQALTSAGDDADLVQQWFIGYCR